MPSLRSVSENANLNPNSTALGMLGKARNPAMGSSSFAGRPGGGGAQIDAMKRAQALLHERMKLGSSPAASSPASPAVAPIGGASNGFQGGNPGMPPPRPGPGVHHNSAPAMPTRSLGERRANRFGGGGLKLSDMANPPPSSSPGGMKRAGAPKLSDMSSNESTPANTQSMPGTKLDDFKQYIDTEKGWITFDGAATITRTGVNFSNGQTFSISLDEVQIVGELGKGNYGTVYKVRHAKPTAPRFGHGLSGVTQSQIEKNKAEAENGTTLDPSDPKGKIMAMKEIRLELDDAKFTTILKELVILHECVSPYIIDFYGAFYQEGAVYMCIEYMDGGSIDKLYGGGMPENILRKVTYSTIMGLKCLKDDHSIIHRDVKPTNVLVNTRGQIKICDFGVSGNLVASIARTNIGCQSYMAPERISGGGMAQTGASDGTYSVQSDVWSLGLTIIECAMGRYPYPPEVSSTIFGQLNVRPPFKTSFSFEENLDHLTNHFTGHCRGRSPQPARHGLLRSGTRLCGELRAQDSQDAPHVRHAAQAPVAQLAVQAGDDHGGGRGGRGSRGRRRRRQRQGHRRRQQAGPGRHRGRGGRAVGALDAQRRRQGQGRRQEARAARRAAREPAGESRADDGQAVGFGLKTLLLFIYMHFFLSVGCVVCECVCPRWSRPLLRCKTVSIMW